MMMSLSSNPFAIEYTTFCEQLGEVGTACYGVCSRSSVFLHFSIIDPYYIIEKVVEKGQLLQKEKHYYIWKPTMKTIQPIVEKDHFIYQYGNIISVSPSKQYCLLLSTVKNSSFPQLSVWDIDNNKLISQCILEKEQAMINVNNSFAGFSWNEQSHQILYIFNFNFNS